MDDAARLIAWLALIDAKGRKRGRPIATFLLPQIAPPPPPGTEAILEFVALKTGIDFAADETQWIQTVLLPHLNEKPGFYARFHGTSFTVITLKTGFYPQPLLHAHLDMVFQAIPAYKRQRKD